METNSRKILKHLKADGWEVVRITGSHQVLEHEDFDAPIVLAHPKKDLPIGMARKIYEAAGWRE